MECVFEGEGGGMVGEWEWKGDGRSRKWMFVGEWSWISWWEWPRWPSAGEEKEEGTTVGWKEKGLCGIVSKNLS